jgi:predicted transcriptional regulator
LRTRKSKITDPALLLSIHPQYADKIFEGTKKVELRKVRPKLEADDWVLVYVSSPIKALVGAFQVERVVESSKVQLWKVVQTDAGITRQEFNAYYDDHSKGIGIFFRETRKFQKPIALIQLKEAWPGFHPPQCHRYLTPEQFMKIEGLGY